MKLKDVARIAGVGAGTVSRALSGNGSVDASTREKVLAVAAELGYTPNTAARALRERRTRTIGLLLPDLNNEFYTSSVAEIHRVLSEAGYQLVIATTSNDETTEANALENMVRQRVEGIIHVPVALKPRYPTNVPLIQLNRRSTDESVAASTSDDVAGVRELTAVAIEAGHRDLAIIVGPEGFSTSVDRLAGALQATEAASLNWKPKALRVRVEHVPLTPDGGARAILNLADDLPTCVIALSSRLVMGVLRQSRELGIEIPRDLSLAGFGDPEWFSIWGPGITTFAPNLTEMGYQAARMLLDKLADKSPVRLALIPGTLQKRGSVTAPLIR